MGRLTTPFASSQVETLAPLPPLRNGSNPHSGGDQLTDFLRRKMGMNNHTIFEPDDAVCPTRHVRFMRHHHNGHAAGIEFSKNVENFYSGVRV